MMHSAGEAGSSTVPAFLTKLWTLVEDPATDHHICWDPSGRSFHVYDQGQFAKEILPLYFKHSNIASFIRQLNMYGFRKVVGIEQGGLKTEKDDMQFVHQYFVRDQDYLLEHIKRKVPNVKSDEVKVKPDDVKWVLSDVRQMRGKQESMNSKLETLKRENEALWREVASLRQKHVKQQQIVNKLIQFLVTLVDNRGLRGGTKRKMAPMITEGESSDAKISKLGQPLSIDSSIVQSADSGSGLLIQDVTGQQLSPTLPTVVSRPSVTHQPSSPTQTDLIMSSLQEGAANDLQSVLGQMEEVKPEEVKRNAAITDQALLATLSGESESAADKLLSGGATATVKPHPVLKRSLSRYDMSDHLDTMQADLESIKDLLTASPQYTFDPTSTLSLFGDQDLSGMVWGMDGSDNTQPSSSAVLGNELIEYTPQDHDLLSLFDLGGIENENEEEKNILEDTLGDLHTPVSAHVSDPMVKASEMAQISTNELD